MPIEFNTISSIARASGTYGQLLAVGFSFLLLAAVATVWRIWATSRPKGRLLQPRSTTSDRRVHFQTSSHTSGKRSKRILLIANDVTLAHFARPYQIAKYLIAEGHEVVLAMSQKSFRFVSSFEGKLHTLRPTDSGKFLDNLKHGRPLFDFEALRRDAQEDEELIKIYQPDLIIGDFRITLSVTARIHNIPYAAISNAYWDSRYQPQFTVPELPVIGYLGVRVSQFIFNIVRPIAFAYHCLPMNALRKYYGLSKRSFDVRDVYSDADMLLFSDVQELYKNDESSNENSWKQKEVNEPHPKELFVGPILWSPEVPLPSWWSQLKIGITTIYVTLGSSGDPQLLPSLVQILKRTKFQIIVSCLGALNVPTAENVFCADFIPSDAACSISDLVICNGGNPSATAAIAKGVPILGIPTNLDQFLNMHYFNRYGASRSLRSGEINETQVLDAVHQLLECPTYKKAAQELSRAVSRCRTADRVCNDAINALFRNDTVNP